MGYCHSRRVAYGGGAVLASIVIGQDSGTFLPLSAVDLTKRMALLRSAMILS